MVWFHLDDFNLLTFNSLTYRTCSYLWQLFDGTGIFIFTLNMKLETMSVFRSHEKLLITYALRD